MAPMIILHYYYYYYYFRNPRLSSLFAAIHKFSFSSARLAVLGSLCPYICMWRDVDRWMYLNASDSLNMGALLFLLLLFLRESLLPLSLIDFAVPPTKPRA